jgi:hypothetical protein
MVTHVLNRLIYNICEVYLDDVIVYAKTEDDFVANTRQIFERIRQYKIVVHPKKIRLGVSEIEYVGHNISETGMSFTKVKTDAVFQTPLPKTEKDLKSFLGLANYFRDHIKDYSTMARPLNSYLKDYKRYHVVKWSAEMREAFESIRAAINECPKLFFLLDGPPVYLHTDASDYGIGAYLFQVRDGKDYPVAFMSRTLSDSQIAHWTTTEKEGFAIVAALQKFEHLLRDIHFTLRTDHRNLTFMNESFKGRVIRWKLAIQEFDFSVEHIPGKDNVVADHLSRDLPWKSQNEKIEELLSDFSGHPSQIVVTMLVKDIDTSMQPTHMEELMAIQSDIRLPDEIYHKIEAVHNQITGHHGVDRTLALLRDKGDIWQDMRLHVQIFIRKCVTCQCNAVAVARLPVCVFFLFYGQRNH